MAKKRKRVAKAEEKRSGYDRVDEVTSKPLWQLDPSEVKVVLDSVCRREPETERRRKRYEEDGKWDMRIW